MRVIVSCLILALFGVAFGQDEPGGVDPLVDGGEGVNDNGEGVVAPTGDGNGTDNNVEAVNAGLDDGEGVSASTNGVDGADNNGDGVNAGLEGEDGFAGDEGDVVVQLEETYLSCYSGHENATLQRCKKFQTMCQTKVEVGMWQGSSSGQKVLVYRECKQAKACITNTMSNEHNCYSRAAMRGTNKRVCHYCCTRDGCNTNDRLPPDIRRMLEAQNAGEV